MKKDLKAIRKKTLEEIKAMLEREDTLLPESIKGVLREYAELLEDASDEELRNMIEIYDKASKFVEKHLDVMTSSDVESLISIEDPEEFSQKLEEIRKRKAMEMDDRLRYIQ